MATVYPRARLEWSPDPEVSFNPDNHTLAFMFDAHTVCFNEEPEAEFYCEPFESNFKPVNKYNFLGVDGEILGADGVGLTW